MLYRAKVLAPMIKMFVFFKKGEIFFSGSRYGFWVTAINKMGKIFYLFAEKSAQSIPPLIFEAKHGEDEHHWACIEHVK